MRHFGKRELAVVVRDFFLHGLPRVLFQLERDRDRLHPVFFLLIDLEQELQRFGTMRRTVEPEKHLFRAVEKPGLEIVLPQFDHRVQPLLPAQIRTFEQVPVHANRPLGLAAAAEQAPQGEVQLDRLRIDLDPLDKGLDRLVGLLVQQKIEALEIRARQLPRFREQLLDVDSRREPAQPEEQREPEQPPELEVHGEFDLGMRRQAVIAGRTQLALELLDFATLPEQARQAGENPDHGAESEKQEQCQDHRDLPGLPEEEAQRHRIRIHEREGKYGEEQQRAQQPRQTSDELHLTNRRKGGTPPLYPQNLSLQKNASLSGSVFSSLPTTSSKANGGTSSMPPSACRRPKLLFLIDPLAQFLAGFEMRHELLRHVHPLARFRIAADARRPMIQPETPEAADLDALPFDQTLRHRIQDHLDGEFGILGDEL